MKTNTLPSEATPPPSSPVKQLLNKLKEEIKNL